MFPGADRECGRRKNVTVFPVRSVTYVSGPDKKNSGGEGGIRTPDTLSGISVFKTDCFNRSHTSPR